VTAVFVEIFLQLGKTSNVKKFWTKGCWAAVRQYVCIFRLLQGFVRPIQDRLSVVLEEQPDKLIDSNATFTLKQAKVHTILSLNSPSLKS
jgi:hypothetical protein